MLTKIRAYFYNLNAYQLATLSLSIGALGTLLVLTLGDEMLNIAGVKVAGKLLNVGLFLIGVTLYKRVFLTQKFPTDEIIASHPVALAIDVAAVSIGIALAVTAFG